MSVQWPAYPAARIAAARVQPHFTRHLAAARHNGDENLAPVPDLNVMESIIGAAFWASLRREEGYVPRISLAFLPPEQAGQALLFERAIPLEPAYLTKLAPAVERPGIHLGVWLDDGQLFVWGTSRTIPTFCFTLEVIAPGLLVIKHSPSEKSAKFVNVAVLEGDQIKVLDENAAALPDCPAMLTSLLGFESTASAEDDFRNVLVQLAVSMRAHGRGGSLLVVPSAADTWRESMLGPIPYAVSPAYTELARLMQNEPHEREQRSWQDQLRRAVDAIAGLTAVDGATVISDAYELLGFGAKIGRREGHVRVEQVMVTEPIEGAEPLIVHPSQLGGTRHQSAVQFAHDQRDSIAMVASQDGRFTVITWSPCADMVHAHRVEALLL